MFSAPYQECVQGAAQPQQPLAQSIAEMGWKQPLVIDGNGVVIVGHCRLLAAKKLGQKEVPCVVADDLTDEQIRKYRLLDNKLAEDIEGLDFEGYELDFEISDIVPPSFDELDADTVPVDHVAVKLTFPDYASYHRVENDVREFANEIGATVVVTK